MKAKQLTRIAMAAAMLAVLSQLALPIGAVPITLQVFGVALCGSGLGKKEGTLAVAVWLLLGAMGAPVFSGFQGGIGHVLGYTGGFLWAFPLLAFCCGSRKSKRSLWGLGACYLAGVMQFMLMAGVGLLPALLKVVLPYLPKDILLTLLGLRLGKRMRS